MSTLRAQRRGDTETTNKRRCFTAVDGFARPPVVLGAFAQDPVKVDAAHYTVVFENPAVRVLKIRTPAASRSTS